MSVGRALRRRGAAELKALSPTRRRVRGTKSSEFVAERRLVWRWDVETGCSMSEMYAGAVLSNEWYASTHILNSIRAAIGSQCKSISALVTCSRGRRSQTRRAAAFKTRCSGARVDWGNPESVALPWSSRHIWQMLARVARPPDVPVIAGEPGVGVAGGRNVSGIRDYIDRPI